MTTVDASGTLHDSKGRFAGRVSGEADVNLPGEAMIAGLSESDIIQGANRLAEKLAKRAPGLDAEEIAADTIAAFLKAASSETKKIEKPREHLKTTAHNVYIHQLFGTNRGPDMQAMGMYLTLQNNWRNEHDSEMTETQKDDLANFIRDEMIANGEQAPLRNFHRRTSMFNERSYDAMMETDDDKTRDRIPGMRADAHHADDNPLAGQVGERMSEALSSVEEGGAAKRSTKAQVWNIMAEQYDAPMSRENVQTKAQAKTNAEAIEQAGGAASVAARILDRDVSDSERNAFTAPWGGRACTNEQVDAIADVMVSNKNYADDLWRAANTASVAPPVRYNSVAAELGAPAVKSGTITPEDATDYADAIGFRGGAGTCAQRIEDGTASRMDMEAFCAPWGGDEEAGRRAANAMLKTPSHADSLWNAALAESSRAGRKTARASS